MQSVFMQGIVAGQIGAASGEEHNSRMTRDRFIVSLRVFSRPAPFKPFIVELISGARLRITNREAFVGKIMAIWWFISDQMASTISLNATMSFASASLWMRSKDVNRRI
jgi:hypothetical protein